MHKSLSVMAAQEKGLWTELVVPKNIFLCSLLYIIAGNSFISEYSISLLHGSSCGHPFLFGYCIYFRRALADVNYVYAMNLKDISIQGILQF